ncbi:hypothetical protein TNCV_1493341 [Trichonephila clavipes]|nr:hypothetical protein TNCV_1493341 [Trichonephila clavipes]
MASLPPKQLVRKVRSPRSTPPPSPTPSSAPDIDGAPLEEPGEEEMRRQMIFRKVTVADDVHYRALSKWLESSGVEFKSFMLKQDRPVKVVIRGLLPIRNRRT